MRVNKQPKSRTAVAHVEVWEAVVVPAAEGEEHFHATGLQLLDALLHLGETKISRGGCVEARGIQRVGSLHSQ